MGEIAHQRVGVAQRRSRPAQEPAAEFLGQVEEQAFDLEMQGREHGCGNSYLDGESVARQAQAGKGWWIIAVPDCDPITFETR